MKKSAIFLAVASAILGAAPAVHAHSYYNLSGPGAVPPANTPGSTAMGFGIANSINGTDGVSANSNGTNRIANGTNTFDPANPSLNNLIPGTGTAATTATEVPGNLPYMWYSGQHTKATGYTKRELFTGSSVTDNTGNLAATLVSTGVLPNGYDVPGTGANYGSNSVNGLWKAYSDKNTGANAATWGTIMADLPGGTGDADHPFLAVAGNSSSTGQGLDYGLIHISCGTNTAGDNCASAGDVLATITVANDSDYPAYNGLLDVALYRSSDTNAGSNRNAAYSLGDANPQGSSLGAPIWTASMSSVSDLLFHTFVFNQSEWNATGTSGFETNGFYTLIVSAHGGNSVDGVAYDVLVTTSPVPIPAAAWLFGSAVLGLFGVGRRDRAAA
jgi:hypothetical protein